MRFSSVAHRAYEPLALFRAYCELPRDSAPGVDGERWADWRDAAPSECRALSEEMASTRYRPRALRAAEVEKPNGGVRLIEVPCLRDKVAQLATARVIAWCYREPFARNVVDLTYGPRRVEPIRRAMPWLRRSRVTLRSDVKDCFGSIQRKRLFAELDRRISDRRVFAWLDGWCRETGLPQGLPVSPVLCAVYMLKAFDGWCLAPERSGVVGADRYVDDVAVGLRSAPRAAEFLDAARARLASYGLALSEEKTRLYADGETVPFLGVDTAAGGEVLARMDATRVQEASDDGRLAMLRHYRRSGVSRKRLRGLIHG